MKASVYSIDGKKSKEVELPKIFEKKVRLDILSKVLESKKYEHPYSPSLVAGKQHSASGVIRHKRHAWKVSYGRGMSRVPRKAMSIRGTQFNWVGAESPQTRGGRRAHPPKVIARMGSLRVNKKENKIAFESALSATANVKYLKDKYSSLKESENIKLPFVIQTLDNIKVKNLTEGIKKIIGKELSNVAFKERAVRSGVGKRRGRKYKSNAGVLIVLGKDEDVRTKYLDIVKANSLNVLDLAKGGPGRLTLYTENAIKELGERK